MLDRLLLTNFYPTILNYILLLNSKSVVNVPAAQSKGRKKQGYQWQWQRQSGGSRIGERSPGQEEFPGCSGVSSTGVPKYPEGGGHSEAQPTQRLLSGFMQIHATILSNKWWYLSQFQIRGNIKRADT